ncbi:Non-catalytic module family DOC2 [Piromyces sp. E2]|nr:Non-catalytic module family DOC2 [Piromyces sp. E2]|eukprot:OUM63095.1 Non-catalytic module family DOC2 [Piromyces sp. E2]
MFKSVDTNINNYSDFDIFYNNSEVFPLFAVQSSKVFNLIDIYSTMAKLNMADFSKINRSTKEIIFKQYESLYYLVFGPTIFKMGGDNVDSLDEKCLKHVSETYAKVIKSNKIDSNLNNKLKTILDEYNYLKNNSNSYEEYDYNNNDDNYSYNYNNDYNNDNNNNYYDSNNNDNNNYNNNYNDKKEYHCLSELKGYPCCTFTSPPPQVYYSDELGDWGYDFENNNWCGITRRTTSSCWSEELGYKCCEGCTVYYSDESGLWGYENDQWCGIYSYCNK